MSAKISDDADAGALTGAEVIPVLDGGVNQKTTVDALATRHAAGGAVKTALDLKAPLASPTLTDTPAAPTAAPGTNTTQIATTGFVKAAVDVVLGGVSAAFDTLSEIATAIGLKAPLISPTLVTPVLGVAAGTSLNLNNAAVNTRSPVLLVRNNAVATTNSTQSALVRLVPGSLYNGSENLAPYIEALMDNTSSAKASLHFGTYNGAAIADRMVIDGDGAVRFNYYTAGTLSTDGSGNITASDERLKNILGPFARGLEAILQIDPIAFAFKSAPEIATAGLSAQNVQTAIPEAVTGSIPGGYLNIDDRAVIAVLVNAVKELAQRVTALEGVNT